MKEYPVTFDELIELGSIGLVSTVLFSLGGMYLNRSWDMQKDLELSQGLPERLVGKWEARADDAWFFGILLCLVGALAVLGGGAKIWSIVRSTRHPDAEQ